MTAIGDGAILSAAEGVAPLEEHLASGENVRAAFLQAGFNSVCLEVVGLSFAHSVEEYVADRALGSSGRLGRDRLGEDAWDRFLTTAEDEFRRRFGGTVSYERRIVLGVGTLD